MAPEAERATSRYAGSAIQLGVGTPCFPIFAPVDSAFLSRAGIGRTVLRRSPEKRIHRPPSTNQIEVKHVLFPLLWLLFLIPSLSIGQPRLDEERPLARAVRAATRAFDQGDYLGAIAEVERRLDSALPAEPRADALYLLARANIELRRYPSALTAAYEFITGYPDDHRIPAISYIYGVAAFESGRIADARGAFVPAAQVNSDDRGRALYWLARINADEGRVDTAQAFAALSLREPEHEFSDNARYLTAWAHESRGELDTATVLYRALIEKNPQGDLVLDAQTRLGVIEARRGHYENAARILNGVTPRTERQREERTFYLAEANSALGNHSEALQGYTEYVRGYPLTSRDRQARYGIGWSQLKLGRYDEAIATFRQLEGGADSIAAASSYQIGAIQLARGDTVAAFSSLHSLLYRLPYESFSDNANYLLGRIHYRRANYDSARHYFLVTARQFPRSDVRQEAYYLLGESYVALGDAKNAAFAFGRTRKVGEDEELNRRALYREGAMLYRSGRFRSAADRFREYLARYDDTPQTPDATFWLGEALYQDRSYAEAERYYDAYLEQTAQDRWREQALFGLAWSRFQQQEFAQAAEAFNSFRKKYPKSDLALDATLREADSYRFLKQYDKAIATYESLGNDKGERTEEARFRMAEIYLQMGEVERSISAFRALVRDYPKSHLRDAYAYNIGSIYREKEMDSLAIEEFRSFLLYFPDSPLAPQALFSIGDAWFNLTEFDSALACYRRVLDEHPSSPIIPEALDAVRFTLNAMGRGSEAVGVIEEFQRKNPDRLAADSLAFRKATIVLEEGDFDGALDRYRRMIVEYPGTPLIPDALFQIGRAYEYRRADDSALIMYDSAVDTYPLTTAGHNALIDGAGLRLRLGRWGDASRDYADFLQRYPESNRRIEALYGLARTRLALGDTAAATASFRQIIDSAVRAEENVFVDRSRIDLARIRAAAGKNDDALDLLASVIARRRDDLAAEALLLRSDLLVASRDYSGALAELRRLTTEFIDYPDFADPGLLRLGNLYELLTNYEGARAAYDTLIGQTEDPDLLSQAQARLKGLKK